MTNKQQEYDELIPQLASLIEGEKEEMSVLANVSAVLKERFGWFWVGFYLEREGELRLGPFQGTLACMHIKIGRGVCGTSFEQQQSIVVPDVEQFPGHIACSSLSRSEIVVPIFDKVYLTSTVQSSTPLTSATDRIWSAFARLSPRHYIHEHADYLCQTDSPKPESEC